MSSVYFVVLMCLHWVGSHPAEVVMVLGAVASLLKSRVEAKWPAVGKVFAFLAHLGVNLTGLRGVLMSEVPVVVKALETAVETKSSTTNGTGK